tara:strand:+ start:3804 stop:3992 length:189 start_codon:yes stop_codon:yes gene_type:complete
LRNRFRIRKKVSKSEADVMAIVVTASNEVPVTADLTSEALVTAVLTSEAPVTVDRAGLRPQK